MITVKKGVDVGQYPPFSPAPPPPRSQPADIGANASAEDAEEEMGGDDVEKVNNVVYSFRLNSTSFDKKSYKAYLGGYMKKVKAALQAEGKTEEEVAAFQKRAQGAAKKILGKFDDFECYVGESMDPEGM